MTTVPYCTFGSDCKELVVPALAVVSGELDEAAAGATTVLASVVAVLLTGTTPAVLPVTLRPGSSFTTPADAYRLNNYSQLLLTSFFAMHWYTCKPELFLANASRFSAKPSPANSHWLSRRKIYKPTPAERPVSHWHSIKFEY